MLKSSPTSHGRKYLLILPPSCMSHGCTNMAQSFCSAAWLTRHTYHAHSWYSFTASFVHYVPKYSTPNSWR